MEKIQITSGGIFLTHTVCLLSASGLIDLYTKIDLAYIVSVHI